MTNHPSPANNSGALFGMTDLEEMLAGPDHKLVVSSLVSRLTHLHERIDASVRSGLRPDEFKRAEALGKALNVARGLLASMPSD